MHSSTLDFPWLFVRFLEASWQAAFLVFVVVGVQRAAGRRLTPHWRHALWWIVVGRLLLPVTPASSWSLFNLVPVTQLKRAMAGEPSPATADWQPVVVRPMSDSHAP